MELSDAGATGPELELSTRAPGARDRSVGPRPGAELELSTRAHGAGLELSDARTTGPSWSCRTRTPAGRTGRRYR